MNPNAEPPPPPPPPQPPRLSIPCVRHPEEQFSSFCPSCLRERLSVLESSPPAAASSSTSRKPPLSATTSSATAAIKAIFKHSGGTGNRTGFFPELRRSKSFSASKNEGLSGAFEPQRKSCDVRARSTLGSLFHQEAAPNLGNLGTSSSSSSVVQVQGLAFESKEEDQPKPKPKPKPKPEPETHHTDYIEIIEEEEEETPNVAVASTVSVIEERVEEIVEEYEQEEELKPMKDHIDLDSQTKKAPGKDLKDIAGSFLSAASVFSKKLQKWRQKQKLKKRGTGAGSAQLPVEKPIGRQYRETQSEIADYGFERRSCDTDPRFSLDAGRISYDDPRHSFDEPRASWDGHLIGRTFQRMPTMVSVVEDAPVHHVMRSDTQIPVEDINEDESLPGGSVQTRDYYSDSSSRRRKSLDRSNSIRKTTAAVVAEMDEIKSGSNAKVSPATVDYVNGPKLVVPDRESISNSNSLRDDYSETFEGKGSTKKSRRWSKAWNILGFINRRIFNKDEDEDRYNRANGVERSYSESWPELRGGFNPRLLRSNSSVSWRSSSSFRAPFVGARKSSVELNGHCKKKKDEFVLGRNRSARYSPNNIDNGLLRFYLTPGRGSRRGGSGKSKASHAHSIARSLLRLY